MDFYRTIFNDYLNLEYLVYKTTDDKKALGGLDEQGKTEKKQTLVKDQSKHSCKQNYYVCDKVSLQE